MNKIPGFGWRDGTGTQRGQSQRERCMYIDTEWYGQVAAGAMNGKYIVKQCLQSFHLSLQWPHSGKSVGLQGELLTRQREERTKCMVFHRYFYTSCMIPPKSHNESHCIPNRGPTREWYWLVICTLWEMAQESWDYRNGFKLVAGNKNHRKLGIWRYKFVSIWDAHWLSGWSATNQRGEKKMISLPAMFSGPVSQISL